MKELRFSIQCGASNRKALVARRCSQCTMDNDDDDEQNEISQQNQLITCSTSLTPANAESHIQSPRRRPTADRQNDSDKFETLLMLAAERTNYLDHRRKKYFHETHHERKRRHLSSSPQRKDIPLVLIEKQVSNQESNLRPHQVRFSTNEGI